MALTLPTTPAARPVDAELAGALEPGTGTDLADPRRPLRAVLRARFTQVEALRTLTDAIAAALVAIDAALAPVARTGRWSDLAGRPAIPSAPGDIGAAPAQHQHPAADISDATPVGKLLLLASSQAAARQAIGAAAPGENTTAAPTSPAATVGGVALDSYPGATDDDKLTAALSDLAAQTIKRPLLLDPRRYDFATPGRALFSGFKLIGPHGHGDQQRSANSIPNDVRFTGAGAWWVPSGTGNQTFDVGFEGLSLQGNAGARFIGGGANVLWCAYMAGLGFNAWQNVLGQPTDKRLLNLCTFDGWWNINNSRDTALTVGGSDCNLWLAGCALDSPPALAKANTAHLILDYLEKSLVGPLYVTAEGSVSSIRINGSSKASALRLFGGTTEGRNSTTPCSGSVIKMTGGAVTLRDWSVNYAMTAPAAGELGVINQSGGKLVIDGLWYDRAAGVGEDVPLLATSAGFARISNVCTGEKTETWPTFPGQPAVRATGTGVIKLGDDSVRLLPA